MDQAEKEEFRVWAWNNCPHTWDFLHNHWSSQKRSRYFDWDRNSREPGSEPHSRRLNWTLWNDGEATREWGPNARIIFNAINAVNFHEDSSGWTSSVIRPTSFCTFRDVLHQANMVIDDEPIKYHFVGLKLFTIGNNTFYALPQHQENGLIRYFYEPEEHKRHPSWPKLQLPYGDEAPLSSCNKLLDDWPPEPWGEGYWEHMEIFRSPLDAPTSYLVGSPPRRLKKPLPLEFGFFLGPLWYDPSQSDHCDLGRLRPTPFVVLIHPIDKSFWVVFNYFPLASRPRDGLSSCFICDECKRQGRDYFDCRFNSAKEYTIPYDPDRAFYDELHPEVSYVAPIERLEDVDFWKELDITPFSLLRIPAFRDGGRRNTAEDMADGKADDDMAEAEEDKGEERSGPDRSPFFEVGLGSVTMRVEAVNVRPNPFKAKHTEWEEYWNKWIDEPLPGDPTSPTHQDSQDEQVGTERSTAPTCRLCNQA